MYGFSYPGATQLLAATVRPPSLVAICPGMTSSQYYEGWTYNGGAFALGFAANWAAWLALEYRDVRSRRARNHAARSACGQVRLVRAPPSCRPAGLHRRGCPVLLRLARALLVRRLLARDRDRRGLLASSGSRAPRRRLVRHLPGGHGEELRRDRADGAAARSSSSGRGSTAPGARCSRPGTTQGQRP